MKLLSTVYLTLVVGRYLLNRRRSPHALRAQGEDTQRTQQINRRQTSRPRHRQSGCVCRVTSGGGGRGSGRRSRSATTNDLVHKPDCGGVVVLREGEAFQVGGPDPAPRLEE